MEIKSVFYGILKNWINIIKVLKGTAIQKIQDNQGSYVSEKDNQIFRKVNTGLF